MDMNRPLTQMQMQLVQDLFEMGMKLEVQDHIGKMRQSISEMNLVRFQGKSVIVSILLFTTGLKVIIENSPPEIKEMLTEITLSAFKDK